LIGRQGYRCEVALGFRPDSRAVVHAGIRFLPQAMSWPMRPRKIPESLSGVTTERRRAHVRLGRAEAGPGPTAGGPRSRC